jgi:3,4-dihydroxy 2-butanone 4-phosphate synthase/GTP cyclohydrolase II
VISGFGLTIVPQEPIELEPSPENLAYLQAKRDKLGHRRNHRGLGGEAVGL